MWTTAAACSLALGLCLCSFPPRGYSVHAGILLLSPNPLFPRPPSSVTPLFSENQILILIKAHKGSSRPAPMTSLPHPLPLPFPPPTQLQPAGSQLLLKQTRHITSAASTQCLLITKGFSETVEKKHSILSTHHSLLSKNFITYHRISPLCYCLSPYYKASYIAVFFHGFWSTSRTMHCSDIITLIVILSTRAQS